MAKYVSAPTPMTRAISRNGFLVNDDWSCWYEWEYGGGGVEPPNNGFGAVLYFLSMVWC